MPALSDLTEPTDQRRFLSSTVKKNTNHGKLMYSFDTVLRLYLSSHPLLTEIVFSLSAIHKPLVLSSVSSLISLESALSTQPQLPQLLEHPFLVFNLSTPPNGKPRPCS